jgi:hypothetical protein
VDRCPSVSLDVDWVRVSSSAVANARAGDRAPSLPGWLSFLGSTVLLEDRPSTGRPRPRCGCGRRERNSSTWRFCHDRYATTGWTLDKSKTTLLAYWRWWSVTSTVRPVSRDFGWKAAREIGRTSFDRRLPDVRASAIRIYARRQPSRTYDPSGTRITWNRALLS